MLSEKNKNLLKVPKIIMKKLKLTYVFSIDIMIFFCDVCKSFILIRKIDEQTAELWYETRKAGEERALANADFH